MLAQRVRMVCVQSPAAAEQEDGTDQGHQDKAGVLSVKMAKAQEQDLLPADLIVCIQEQLARINRLQADIDRTAQRLRAMIREDLQMQAIGQIPGVGELITASALVATVGDFRAFKSARQFASWAGFVPRQVGTGGKTRQLGISKRGDAYLRILLISGARAVIARSKTSDWVQRLLQRRHYNVAVVALAHKMARTVWTVLARGVAFEQSR